MGDLSRSSAYSCFHEADVSLPSSRPVVGPGALPRVIGQTFEYGNGIVDLFTISPFFPTLSSRSKSVQPRDLAAF